MITVSSDGLVEPFGITLSRESKHQLLATARDISEEKAYSDGDIDFGTELKNGEWILRGIIEVTTVVERYSAKTTLASQLLNYLKPQKLFFEDNPNMYTMARLSGKPEIIEYPLWIDISIPFSVDPFWYSINENFLIGNGVIVNSGTFETPILIEIPGPVTSPSIVVDTSTISYTGNILADQTLIIDTSKQIAYISATALTNATANISGNIDYMLEPQISVAVTPSISTIAVKWHDMFL